MTPETELCAKRGCRRPRTHIRLGIAGKLGACDQHVIWLDECIRSEEAAGCHPMCPPAWAIASSTCDPSDDAVPREFPPEAVR